MRKTKLLLGSAILSVALLGTGYAYWTDALTVNTTIKTGEFNVKMFPVSQGPDQAHAGNEYVKSEVSDVKEKEVTFKFSNMYPGAKSYYAVAINNDGTIPAVIDTCVVTPDNNELLNNIQFKVSKKVHGQTTSSKEVLGVAALQTEITSLLKDVRLEEKDTMSLIVESTMNKDVDGNKLEKASGALKLNINWKQHNTTK
ncbi:MAG: SipW-dependent-type signal peptide-containing protein [Cellulosilyticaceae bacterium]